SSDLAPHNPINDRICSVQVRHYGGVVVPVTLQLKVPGAILEHGLSAPREHRNVAVVLNVCAANMVGWLLAPHIPVTVLRVGMLWVVRVSGSSWPNRNVPAAAHPDCQEAITCKVLIDREAALPLAVLFPALAARTPEGDHISVMDLVGIPDVPTAGSGTFPSPLVQAVGVVPQSEWDRRQDVVNPDLLLDPGARRNDELLQVVRRPHVTEH